MEPPFKPDVTTEESNDLFDDEFTEEVPQHSFVDSNLSNTLLANEFQGFTFTGDSALDGGSDGFF